jgi:hypothetical protein
MCRIVHPAFAPAVDKVRSSIDQDQNPFAMAAGAHAAIVLAGFGLSERHSAWRHKRTVGNPSDDIDAARRLFRA